MALVILGIDPGSNTTGYGVIAAEGRTLSAVDYGIVKAPARELGARIADIFHGVAEVAARHRPDEVALERAFVHVNPATAIALGQARGAALAAVVNDKCVLAEYAPRAVKLALVGSGKAGKGQVAHMVRHLLKITGPLAEDAADALAVAVCHAHSRTLAARTAVRT